MLLLLSFIREARAQRDQHLEEVFGTKDVPYAEKGVLLVRLPEAVADAFVMVMNYIYTDRIQCKWNIFSSQATLIKLKLNLFPSTRINCNGRQTSGPGDDGHLPVVGAIRYSATGADVRAVLGAHDLEGQCLGSTLPLR